MTKPVNKQLHKYCVNSNKTKINLLYIFFIIILANIVQIYSEMPKKKYSSFLCVVVFLFCFLLLISDLHVGVNTGLQNAGLISHTINTQSM